MARDGFTGINRMAIKKSYKQPGMTPAIAIVGEWNSRNPGDEINLYLKKTVSHK
jgi:hypothetical protein